MKTTVDLPDDLLREVKILAAKDNRKLKDILADLIVRGLGHRAASRRRLPEPAKLIGGPITADEVESAITFGRG